MQLTISSAVVLAMCAALASAAGAASSPIAQGIEAGCCETAAGIGAVGR